MFISLKTTEPSFEFVDEISEHLVPGEASITTGPVFRDYAVKVGTTNSAVAETPEPMVPV